MTQTNNIVAKLAVAFVAVAMAFTLAAPSVKAQDVSSMSLEQLIALVNQLQAQLSGSATTGSCSYTFTRSLGQGSTGADVMNLQKFLNMSADTQVSVSGAGAPGMETSYYGPATAAAVSKFQTKYSASILVPSGLTTPTGYFGPASMAKANALCAAGTGTGTGTGSTSGALQGGAGSISVTTTTSDVEDQINTGDSENILGFKIEADGSDVEVTNLKISFSFTGSASSRLERYFDSFDVVMDGETVGSVDADDFTRDSAGEYSKTVSLKNAIVREDEKNTFYIVGNAVSDIDSANAGSSNGKWKVTATNFRYVDGQGAIISDGTTGINNSDVNVVKLASSGDVKVKVSLGSNNPSEGTVKVSDDTSGDLVTLLEFRVKAEGTDVAFDQIRFNLATTTTLLNTMVSEYRLMKGSSVLQTADSSDVTATTSSAAILTMSLDDQEEVDQDDTETYKLVAKMNKNTWTANSSITASIPSTYSYWLNAEDMNGDMIADARFSGSAMGNKQTFRGDGLFAEIDSTTANQLSKTVSSTAMQYGEFKFVVDITADGDDFYFASTSAPFDYQILNANTGAVYADEGDTASSTAALTSNATKTSGGDYVIYDGETKSVTYTITMTTGAAAGTYKALANDFEYGTSTSVLTGTTLTLTPTGDFTTGTVNIQ